MSAKVFPGTSMRLVRLCTDQRERPDIFKALACTGRRSRTPQGIPIRGLMNNQVPAVRIGTPTRFRNMP